jgi:hypothetical protein
MPKEKAAQESTGFSAEERAAMKERAAELRAEGKKGAKQADGLQAVLDRIAGMAPEDRALAERVHVAVTGTAPQLSPRTWYGMPAYARLQRHGEPRRRRPLAGVVRAEGLESRGGEEGPRPGEGRHRLTGSPTCRRVARHPRPGGVRRGWEEGASSGGRGR